MKLEHKLVTDYICDLTRDLDTWANFDKEMRSWRYHYIMISSDIMINRALPIRVPGGTVGTLYVDEEDRIKKIYIDTGYVVRTYPENINELVKKYVGQVIDFGDVSQTQ